MTTQERLQMHHIGSQSVVKIQFALACKMTVKRLSSNIFELNYLC